MIQIKSLWKKLLLFYQYSLMCLMHFMTLFKAKSYVTGIKETRKCGCHRVIAFSYWSMAILMGENQEDFGNAIKQSVKEDKAGCLKTNYSILGKSMRCVHIRVSMLPVELVRMVDRGKFNNSIVRAVDSKSIM